MGVPSCGCSRVRWIRVLLQGVGGQRRQEPPAAGRAGTWPGPAAGRVGSADDGGQAREGGARAVVGGAEGMSAGMLLTVLSNGGVGVSIIATVMSLGMSFTAAQVLAPLRRSGAGADSGMYGTNFQSPPVDPGRTPGVSDRAGRTDHRQREPVAPFQAAGLGVGGFVLDSRYRSAHAAVVRPARPGYGMVAGPRSCHLIRMSRSSAARRVAGKGGRLNVRYQGRLAAWLLQELHHSPDHAHWTAYGPRREEWL